MQMWKSALHSRAEKRTRTGGMSMSANRIRGLNRLVACLDSSKKNVAGLRWPRVLRHRTSKQGTLASSSCFLLMPLS